MTLREQIAQQALSLPLEDREYVADLLESSLPATKFNSTDVADAWSQEIDRRIAVYDRGESKAIEIDVALQTMRQAMLARRQ